MATSSPLCNSIRSFWTPEKSTDPEFLRLIRIDKATILITLGAVLVVAAAIIAPLTALVL